MTRREVFPARLVRLAGCCALACGLAWTVPLRAADGVTIDRVQVGFAGLYKVGQWAPVTVDVTSATARRVQLVVEAPDPDGSWTSIPTAEQELPAGTHRLRGLLKTGRLTNAVRIQIRDAGGVLSAWSSQTEDDAQSALAEPLKQSAMVAATLGKPAGFHGSRSDQPASGGSAETATARSGNVHLAELASFDQLPLEFAAYESLDLLAIAGKYDIDAERSELIRQWVRSGGRLILSVGRNFADFETSPLNAWLPFTVKGSLSLRELGGLESFAGRGSRLLHSGETITSAKIEVREGEVLASGFDGPLVVRSPVGLGQVTVVAVDLDVPPLSTWPSIDYLARKLIGDIRDAEPSRMRESATPLAQSDLSELATQFYRTLDGFGEVRRTSTWMVMGLLIVYLLVIGPLDYLLVHRVLRRPQWTWFTFPAMVIAAVSLTVWGAERTNGRTLRLNQLEVIDIDPTSHSAVLRTWASVYSPETRRYRVELQPPASLAGDVNAYPFKPVGMPHGSWQGLPEDIFGGMYRAGGIDFGRSAYSLLPGASGFENLPIAVWSAKNLTSTWQAEMPSLIEAELSSRGPGHLTGTLRHHFRGPLKDWIIAHGRQVYRPVANARTNPEAQLPPLVRWSVEEASPRELGGYLTGTTQQYVESQSTSALELVREQIPYEKTSQDPGYVLRMLTFYQAAGGKDYVGLDNHALRAFDLTPLLGLNRAVLFGRIDGPAASVRINGSEVTPDRHSTYVRIVLPVRDTRRSGR